MHDNYYNIIMLSRHIHAYLKQHDIILSALNCKYSPMRLHQCIIDDRDHRRALESLWQNSVIATYIMPQQVANWFIPSDITRHWTVCLSVGQSILNSDVNYSSNYWNHLKSCYSTDSTGLRRIAGKSMHVSRWVWPARKVAVERESLRIFVGKFQCDFRC